MSILNNMYRTIVLAILLTYAGVAEAHGSLRCKGRIIDVGNSVAEVVSLCGEPAERIITQVPVRAGVMKGFTRFAGFALTEQWIYNRGWGKFPAVLYFDNGKIQRIEYLRYRSGKE